MKFILLFLSLLFITACATQVPVPPPLVEKNGQKKINPEYLSLKLNERYSDFRQCFIKENPMLYTKVRVDMEFEVSDKGKILNSKITSKDIKSPTSFACMKTILNEIHYPATGNGESVLIIQPVDFRNK